MTEGQSPESESSSLGDVSQSSLRSKSLRGGLIVVTGQLLRVLLRIVGIAVLARLLTPEDFGLITMVIVTAAFLDLLRDLGLADATVQRGKVSHSEVNSLFWLNTMLGGFAAVLACGLAPAVAWFYAEPRLLWMTVPLALAYLVSGTTVQHEAVLRRSMQFNQLVAIELGSVALALATGIAAAYWGAGYWVLVWIFVSERVFMSLGFWWASPWRPKAPSLQAVPSEMLSFGMYLTGSHFISFLNRNLDNLLIGWKLGSTSLGLYSRAYDLLLAPMRMINLPVSRVALPTLSRLVEDPERFRRYYRKGLLTIAAVNLPIVVGVFVAADRVVLVLLGSQWTEVIEIFRALGPAAIVSSVNVAFIWALLPLGNTKRAMIWSLVTFFGVCLALVVGLPWGVLGVAWAYSVAMFVLFLPGIAYCFYGTPLRLRDLGWALSWPMFVSIGAGGLLWLLRAHYAESASLIFGLVLDVVLYALLYGCLWLLCPGGMLRVREILELRREWMHPK